MNNFSLRTISGALYVAIMVGCLLFYPAMFGALFIVVMAVAMQEFYRMAMGGRYFVPQKLAILTGFTFFTLVSMHCGFGMEARWIALGIVPLTATMLAPIFYKERPDFVLYAYIFVGLLYIAAPIALSPYLVFSEDGDFNGKMLLSFFIIIWCSDTGAYCLGTLFGQKPDSWKLAPSISPKKSWWGFWGGIILGVAAAVVLHFVGWLDFSLVHCMAAGAIISGAGVCGDLFESMWKRWFEVKDSGNCIPGHGGMLDRFDSSLIAIPLVSAYLAVFNLL